MPHRARHRVLTLLVMLLASFASVMQADEEDVDEWFDDEGPQAAASSLEVSAADLTIGEPSPVGRWSQDYAAGNEADEPYTFAGQWVAPVTVEDGDSDEPQAVLRAAQPEDQAISAADVIDDAELAEALQRLEEEVPVVYDDQLDAWFAAGEDEIWPLTEAARTVLSGPVSYPVFQPYVAERHATAQASPAPEDGVTGGTVRRVGVIAAIVLVGVAATILLRRQARRREDRIAADVHASTPPPDDSSHDPEDAPRHDPPDAPPHDKD